MTSVSCPQCGRLARLPAADLPAESLVQCPACRQTLAADRWLEQLPPLATVLRADGTVVDVTGLGDAAASQPTASEPAIAAAPAVDDEAGIKEGAVDRGVGVDAGLDSDAESDDEIDLDAEIEFDESPSHSGISQIGIDEDAFSVGQAQTSPSSDPTELPCESPEAWEPQDPISDADVFGDHDDEEFNAADELDEFGDQPERRKVPLVDDDRSYYERHQWGRRQRDSIRLLKIASPTLVALPIIAAILYVSGFSFGLDFFRRSDEEVASASPSTADHGPRTSDEASAAARPPAGRVLVDAGSAAEDNLAIDEPEVEPELGEAGQGDSGTNTPEEIVAGLFQPDRDVEDDSQPELPSIDQMLEGLKQTGETIAKEAKESDAESEQSSAVTIAMRAKRQWEQRNRQPPQEAAEREAALLNSATLSFPHQPPSADAILQTSAESAIEPLHSEPLHSESLHSESASQSHDSGAPESELPKINVPSPERSPERSPDHAPESPPVSAPEVSVPEVDTPEPETAEPETAEPETAEPETAEPETAEPETAEPETAEPETAELAVDEPDRPEREASRVDSPDLINGCERAGELIGRLQSDRSEGTSAREDVLARLRAYRAVAQVGSSELAGESPCVARLLDSLASSPALQQLEPLCGEWIDWGRRQTDGMLLIGELKTENTETYFELSDGTRIDVRLPNQLDLPVGSRCAAIGKIISTEDVPLIRLVAGVVVP
ncbi:hypothetical protein [Stieleria mannarensis]|uniref:hypothetical protein n=1 Tax=Stieleria mannarensis TaxID=2755585 RepID=UPI0015FFFBB8|nr:hypothetical protein [Rhodopirellula sp. JC639]